MQMCHLGADTFVFAKHTLNMYFEKCKKDSFGMIRIWRKLVMTPFKYIHEVCVRVGGRTLHHNQIFSDVIFYQSLLSVVLRWSESSAVI